MEGVEKDQRALLFRDRLGCVSVKKQVDWIFVLGTQLSWERVSGRYSAPDISDLDGLFGLGTLFWRELGWTGVRQLWSVFTAQLRTQD